MIKELAHIKSIGLDWKDRGILTFWINVDYENGWSQGVGGYALDNYDPISNERVGTAQGLDLIMALSKCLDVNNLTEAKGQTIFVLGEGDALNFKPIGIQALKSNGGKKVIFSEIFKRSNDDI
jgi:hypothetical protein